MVDPDKHGVHGRLASNGQWELISPVPKTVEKKFLFFKWQATEHAPLNREDAIKIAEKHWRGGQGAYQDIIVLQENYDEEGWRAICVWKNGSPYRY